MLSTSETAPASGKNSDKEYSASMGAARQTVQQCDDSGQHVGSNSSSCACCQKYNLYFFVLYKTLAVPIVLAPYSHMKRIIQENQPGRAWAQGSRHQAKQCATARLPQQHLWQGCCGHSAPDPEKEKKESSPFQCMFQLFESEIW